MDPQTIVLILTVLGLGLVIAEIFIPSGGMIGVFATCVFIVATYFAYVSWYETKPIYLWSYVTFVAMSIPAFIVAAILLLDKTSLGNKILLKAPQPEEITPYQREQEHLRSLIGKRGRALNLMMPGGFVSVGGERLHAIAETMTIPSDSPVEIVEVRGTRVIVRPVESTSEEPQQVVQEDRLINDDSKIAKNTEDEAPLDPFAE